MLFQDSKISPVQTARKKVNRSSTMISWWTKDSLINELSLNDEQKKIFHEKLEREQVLSQVLTTKIKKIKRELQPFYLNSENKLEEGLHLLSTKLYPLLHEQEIQRMKTRLFVRELLSPSQLEIIKKNHPKFFGMRWFKRSRIPVIAGEVIQKKAVDQ